MLVEAFQDGDGHGALVLSALVLGRQAVVAGVPFEDHPGSNQEVVKLSVVGATVAIQLFLKHQASVLAISLKKNLKDNFLMMSEKDDNR